MSNTENPVFVFVLDDKIGGVASLNKNLINNTSLRAGIYIKVILLDQADSDHPRLPDEIHADEIVRFRYNTYENKYSILKRLHKLFGDNPGALIINDGLEMQAIYEYGTNKTVFQIIHDFYNIRLAVKYGAITDVYVTHTRLFKDILESADPVSTQAFCILHGVTIPELSLLPSAAHALRIAFVGRLVEGKGVQDLFHINQVLMKRGIIAEWTIIGKGQMKDFLENQWKNEKNVQFVSPDTNKEVLSILSRHDLFVLPTRFEGSPVSILEALAAGVVPIVSDLPGGIREVVNEEVGRRVPVGDIELFARAITDMNNNRELMNGMKINARKLAENNFDISRTSDNYFKIFAQYKSLKKNHGTLQPIKPDFLLDKKWLPNAIVSFIRRRARRN